MFSPCHELFSAAPTFKEPAFLNAKEPPFLDDASHLNPLREDYSTDQQIQKLEDIRSSIVRELGRLEVVTRDIRFAGLVADANLARLSTPLSNEGQLADETGGKGVATTGSLSGEPLSPRSAVFHKQASVKWEGVVEQIESMELDSFPGHPKSKYRIRRSALHLQKNRRILLDVFMGIVIVTNAVTIGASYDIGSPSQWVVVEMIFAVIYLLEICTKFVMMGSREFFIGEEKYWNVFEVLLVLAGCFELISAISLAQDSDSMSMLGLTRMLKVARVARLVRLIRFEFFKELLLMLTGTVGGLRTLFWSFVLISWPLYISSLIFRQTLEESSRESGVKDYFASVPMSFFTVFRCLVPGECTDRMGRPLFYIIVKFHGWLFAIAYVGLVMLMQFGLFNVIIAIFVENVMIAARSDSERLRKHRRQNQEFFNGKMVELFNRIWELHLEMCKEKGTPIETPRPSKPSMKVTIDRLEVVEITKELFDRLLADRKGKEIFQDLEVADDDQMNLFEMLDADCSGTLEVPELYMGISKLRGPARRSDLITSELLLRTLIDKVAIESENETK